MSWRQHREDLGSWTQGGKTGNCSKNIPPSIKIQSDLAGQRCYDHCTTTGLEKNLEA